MKTIDNTKQGSMDINTAILYLEQKVKCDTCKHKEHFEMCFDCECWGLEHSEFLKACETAIDVLKTIKVMIKIK